MIITYKPFGRLGNRLFLFAHLMAFSDLYSISVRNFAFQEYVNDFPYWVNHESCQYGEGEDAGALSRYPLPLLKLADVFHVFPRVEFWGDRDVIFDEEDSVDPRIRKLIEARAVFFEGWKFRSHKQILLSKPKIKDAFRPNVGILKKTAQRLARARQRGDKVLGVHVRWEDYRGTERFFTIQQFVGYIEAIRSSLGGHKVCCLVCSPEQFDEALLPPECIVLRDGSPVTDLYTLSECDYVLGPPSTFSGWASFYGDKPVLFMRDQKKMVGLECAEVVRW